MRTFTTPPKDPHNRLVITSMPREGDWICFSCNNLNFAFRKKCNRCRATTREENQPYPAYYAYQIHSGPYYGQPQTHDPKFSIDTTPPKHRGEDPEEEAVGCIKLPSVSPIVKRYRSGRLGGECEESSPSIYNECLKWDLSFQEGLGDPEEFQIIDRELEEMVTRIII